MLIYVNCLTYGYKGKSDHIFNVDKNDTLLSLKEKIISHFKVSENIHMFDTKTERLLTYYEYPLKDCFSQISCLKDIAYSITFSEYKPYNEDYEDEYI